jgi:hypothetical protein
MLIFYDFAWFCAAYICVYFQYLFMHCVCANIFGAIVLKLRFKIDDVVMIIWSIVIIINSVLTLQVSTASLPHDRKPCEIKVVSNHTCSLHTCVCAGSRRVRIRLSGFRRQGISSTPGGFLKCPIPVRVCANSPNSTADYVGRFWFTFRYRLKCRKNVYTLTYTVHISNGNASETKANESFDNGVFFDIEAKRTPSIVS